jgi:hypothetical protein
MYAKPKVGDFVTVTTQYKSTVLGSEFDENLYKNLYVLESQKYDRPNTFRIPCTARHMDERVIECKHVIKLVINGRLVAPIDGDFSIKTVQVDGSKKGSKYTVTFEDGSATCTCVGFSFRKNCRHLGEADAILKSSVDLKA